MAAVSVAQTSTPGIALTYVAQVTVRVDAYDGLITAGLGYSEFFGNFSWGRIDMGARSSPKAFTAYTNNGFTGLSTSAGIPDYRSGWDTKLPTGPGCWEKAAMIQAAVKAGKQVK